MRDIVHVLHANHRRDLLRFRELRGVNVAQADVFDQTLLLEFGQNLHRFGHRHARWFRHAAGAQVDHVERVQPQVAQVVMDGALQALAGVDLNPGFVLAANRAHLGDDHQTFRVRVERLLDDLVGDVRARRSRWCRCGFTPASRAARRTATQAAWVAWRSVDAGTGELHGAVAHAVDGHGGAPGR